MKDQTTTQLIPAPEIFNLVEGDPFFELAQEINELITSRAYELFASNGFAHGHDREDWLRAESEIILDVPLDVTETDTELTIRAGVPGFSGQNIQVRVAPRSLCITGKRQATSEQKEGKIIYFERSANQVFRVLGLASEVDTRRVNATLTDGDLEIRLLKVSLGKKVPILAVAAGA
jgi:HSP20 family protein